MRPAPLVAFALALLCVPHAAAAGDPPDASAKAAESRALFDAAMKLREEAGKDGDMKKWEQACPKFEQSSKLQWGLGTSFYLAECWEKTGRLASAHALYVEVADSAEEMKMKERADFAKKRAEALAPRLVKLQIEVPEAVGKLAGFAVQRGDLALAPAQWATALPVDPGAIVVSAVADGKKRWETTVDATKEGATVIVRVPVLDDAPKLTAPLPTSTASASTEPAAPVSSGWSTRKTAGVALLGVGGASIIAGAILGGLVPGQKSTIDAHCQPAGGINHCDAQGGSATDTAFALANGSNLTFALGAVLAAAGGGLLLLGSDDKKVSDPPKKAPAARRGAPGGISGGAGASEGAGVSTGTTVSVGAAVSFDVAGVTLRGRW